MITFYIKDGKNFIELTKVDQIKAMLEQEKLSFEALKYYVEFDGGAFRIKVPLGMGFLSEDEFAAKFEHLNPNIRQKFRNGIIKELGLDAAKIGDKSLVLDSATGEHHWQ